MIIDKNLIFIDGAITTTGNSSTVGLTSLTLPAKLTTIPITIRVTETFAGATSIVFKLQQADSSSGSFTDVSGASITLAATDLVKGKKSGWPALPVACTKPWLRISYTVTAASGSSVTAGKIFCAVVPNEDQPYESGQYANS